ncbi:MAG: dephospho-CoA kinase [Ignavibacteriales bacterium]|nr:dephospho-CoA kinase [Ignavibacteriales bacterium]MCB9219306.1 dephospho-CoA kinase [Ignavibacteriales bacterium]
MKNLIIGITGGIGSGKTTVSKYYEQNGYIVLRADDIAKQTMIDNSDVREKIIKQFGKECYNGKKLNTKILADKVFNHPKEIGKLNIIVHPPTINKITEEIQKYDKDHKIIFVEAALLFEAKMEDLFDYILLITADEDTRIKRVLERNHETASEIRSRILNQLPEDQKRKKSDFVIDNLTTLSDLENKAIFFLNLFKALPAKN